MARDPGAGDANATTLSTTAMNRLLQYEPADLTLSVEAGMPYAVLEATLAQHRQMLPLDPSWAAESTVGGVVAANLSGPRRRLYGTARDMIIGMTFATLEGKLIQSGGMVVKNVAGLDMAKLLVGSFGTLAAMAIINFKVCPMPAESRTFALEFQTAKEAFDERNRILESVLQPSAVDVLKLALPIPSAGSRGRERAGVGSLCPGIASRADADGRRGRRIVEQRPRVHAPISCREPGRWRGRDLDFAYRHVGRDREDWRAGHRPRRIGRFLRALCIEPSRGVPGRAIRPNRFLP